MARRSYDKESAVDAAAAGIRTDVETGVPDKYCPELFCCDVDESVDSESEPVSTNPPYNNY